MNNFEIFFIALALSADTFAVSVASGVNIGKSSLTNALKMGIFFGGFQALMPVIGWLAGNGMKSFVSGFAHWIAFFLLFFIGGKMIWESFQLEEAMEKKNPFRTFMLLILAIATSIDALAVGITFSMIGISIILPVMVIGGITFCVTLLGLFVGKRMAHFFENKIEIAGGIILMLIGVKILFQHYDFF